MNNQNQIRVRFAPSPTGHLHIGGARTALFNFLYAKQQGGKFLLRVEDTDAERSTKEFEEEILDSMKWLGLEAEEDMIRQSDRISHYRELAEKLIAEGLAYEKDSAIFFKMPNKEIRFKDLIKGDLSQDASLFDDLVIIKSDGFPTYHLACVADDAAMNITHVIRGDDHLSNTPRQVALYLAFGWKPPKYAHLPLIMGEDGAPLSKRHGAVSVGSYQELGYLPEGLLNYLALLGWGPSNNQEYFSFEDLMKHFSLKKVTKSNAQFSFEKLDWLNAQHIKKMDIEEYLKKIKDFWKGLDEQDEFYLLYKTRIKNFSDLKKQSWYFFEDEIEYDLTKAGPWLDASARDLLTEWRGFVADIDFSKHEVIEEYTRKLAEEKGMKAADFIHPLRFALTSETVSPGLFELMSVLGKERCLRRVNLFCEAVEKGI